MKTATVIARWTIRITGLIQILLGLAFWAGTALSLLPIHMLVGLLLVGTLWVLAALAARAGVSLRVVALVAVWGLIVPILGVTQAQLLPGDAHWVIEVIHLVVGLIAIVLGNRVAKQAEQRLKQMPLAAGYAAVAPTLGKQ